MIDEWSSEVTLALQRMLTDVSTVHSVFLVFCVFSLHEFLLNGFSHGCCCSKWVTCELRVCLHMSPWYVVLVTLA